MLDKIGAAIKKILTDLSTVQSDVSALQQLPAPKDGEPGISPDVDAIVSTVLAQIPTPKDGTSPDIDAVSFKVLSQMAKPKDGEPGKDGTSPAMADIVSEVLAKIRTPEDGHSPDIDAIVRTVLSKVPAPKVQAAAPAPAAPRPGKDGVSVTKVKLEKGNKLAVWLDGVRRVVGTIELPKPVASFTPAAGGGGGSRRSGGSDPNTAAIIRTMQTRAAMGNTVSDTGVLQAVLTGTGDAMLPPPTTAQPPTGGSYNGYERVDGLVKISKAGELSVSSGALIIGTNGAGDYRAPHAWVGMSSSVTATTVGFVFGILKASDGLIRFSQRVTGGRMSAQDDLTNVSGGGFVESLEPGDTLSMWVASDKTATITIYDMNIGLEMAIAESLK